MTPGGLEKIPLPFEKIMSDLEMRVMGEIVRVIKINGFSTSTADWQMKRMIQLGRSEEEIKRYIKAALDATDAEIEQIYSDTVYEQYYGYGRAYKLSGASQIPFKDNVELQMLINAVKAQTSDTFKNLTNSMGFAIRDPATGKISHSPLMEFYQNTLSNSVMDIISGTASYDKALKRAINTMTNSGLRWIDYESGVHNRVDVAARRAVMTGFRQVQGLMNEQVAKELGSDYYEVTYHVGARPTHQPWQGRVWSYKELESVCGLGSVTGLHGANCYHDYNVFIPGISTRTYTDEQLDQMIAEENTTRYYGGKEYTTYQALQEQRRQERNMRKTRQDIKLLQDGDADKNTVTLIKAKYQGQMQTYKDFSRSMRLPEQKQRIYRDGLGNVTVKQQVKHNIAANSTFNTGKKVYFDNSRTYRIDLPDYPQNINDKLSVAAKTVAEKGSETMWEYGVFVDLDSGKIGKYVTDEEPYRVYPDYKYFKEHPNSNVAFIHNHIEDTELSLPDIGLLANDEQIKIIAAVRNDGIITLVESNGNKSEEYIYSEFEEERSRKRKELEEKGYCDHIALETYTRDIAIKKYGKGGMIIFE